MKDSRFQSLDGQIFSCQRLRTFDFFHPSRHGSWSLENATLCVFVSVSRCGKVKVANPDHDIAKSLKYVQAFCIPISYFDSNDQHRTFEFQLEPRLLCLPGSFLRIEKIFIFSLMNVSVYGKIGTICLDRIF